MTPAQQAGYRARTHGAKPYNQAQKTCHCCKQRRSIGQFNTGSGVCVRCELRGGK